MNNNSETYNGESTDEAITNLLFLHTYLYVHH